MIDKSKPLKSTLESLGLQFQEGYLKIPPGCKKVKIDVGLSFNAKQSLRWLEEDSELFVLGFEPVLKSVQSIQDLMSASPSSLRIPERFLILPIALGSENSTTSFYVTRGDSGTSSLLKPKHFEVSMVTSTLVLRLDDILDFFPWHKIPRIDFLKTDCQGMDIEVLRGSKRYLGRVAVVTAEADSTSYESSSNNVYSIRKFMDSCGFVMLNPRSRARILIGKIVENLPLVVLFVKKFVPVARHKIRHQSMSIEVDDPTFFNLKYLAEIRDGKITAFQRE